MNTVIQGSLFLVGTIFSFYITCLLLRIFLQWAGLQYYNQLAQFVSKLTNPVILPLRRILPRVRSIDLAGWTVAFVLTWIKLLLLFGLQMGRMPAIVPWLLWAIPELLSLSINIFFFAILGRIILSYLSPAQNHPLLEALHRLTEPLLRPARQRTPLIAGFDLSPMFVLIAMQFFNLVCTTPIEQAITRLL